MRLTSNNYMVIIGFVNRVLFRLCELSYPHDSDEKLLFLRPPGRLCELSDPHETLLLKFPGFLSSRNLMPVNELARVPGS